MLLLTCNSCGAQIVVRLLPRELRFATVDACSIMFTLYQQLVLTDFFLGVPGSLRSTTVHMFT